MRLFFNLGSDLIDILFVCVIVWVRLNGKLDNVLVVVKFCKNVLCCIYFF